MNSFQDSCISNHPFATVQELVYSAEVDVIHCLTL